MSPTILHRVRFVLIACIALLALPGASLAAPPTFHGTYEFTDDVTICGVDGTIHVTGAEVIWVEGDSFRITGQGTDTFTTADGRSVVLHFAGKVNVTETFSEDGSTLVVLSTYRGMGQSIRGGEGGMVMRDAGVITFIETIDLVNEELISIEVIDVRGPHPQADSNFTNFCDAFLEALG